MSIQLATPRQIDLLKTLAVERVLEAHQETLLRQVFAGTRAATKTEASMWISTALGMPRQPKAAAAAPAAAPGMAALVAAFDRVEVGKYAVPARGIQIPGVNVAGVDLLFLEVREWKGRKYLNRLTGAPGDFRRSHFGISQTIALLGVIAGRHVEYGEAFGRHYTCCGRCAAPLTDARSRQTHFGPECRRIFGIA